MARNSKKRNNNIEKIAKTAGVSIATVSRAFNNHPYVKENVRKKIIQAAHKSGYKPKIPLNEKTIGVIIGAALGPFEGLMLNSLIQELCKREQDFEIIHQKNLGSLEKRFLKLAISFLNEDYLPKLQQYPYTHFICLNKNYSKYSCVSFDYAKGIEQAVDFLVAKGHCRIALLIDRAENWPNSERRKGYETAMTKNDCPLDPELIVSGSRDSVLEDTAKLMLKKPDAVIITSGQKGLQFTYALNLLGKKVPEDLSVISFEIPNVSSYIWPPHTTVSQDFGNLSEVVVEIVKKALEFRGKSFKPVHRLVKHKIIERDSVRTK